jgi:hypothetical protein
VVQSHCGGARVKRGLAEAASGPSSECGERLAAFWLERRQICPCSRSFVNLHQSTPTPVSFAYINFWLAAIAQSAHVMRPPIARPPLLSRPYSGTLWQGWNCSRSGPWNAASLCRRGRGTVMLLWGNCKSGLSSTRSFAFQCTGYSRVYIMRRLRRHGSGSVASSLSDLSGLFCSGRRISR